MDWRYFSECICGLMLEVPPTGYTSPVRLRRKLQEHFPENTFRVVNPKCPESLYETEEIIFESDNFNIIRGMKG